MLRGMALKLYGHDTSPYVRRVRVLLAEKYLNFERDTDSWTVPHGEISRINPMLRVPALIDMHAKGGQPQYVLDSKLIAIYLYDRYTREVPTSPKQLPLQTTLFHPAHRYDDENALLCIDAATDSAINVFLLELDGITADQSPYLGRQLERIKRCLGWLDARLDGRSTFHDGAFGFLDIALVCSLDWMLFRKRCSLGDFHNLARFLEGHRDRPSLASTHPSQAANAALPITNPQRSAAAKK